MALSVVALGMQPTRVGGAKRKGSLPNALRK
jgi:hypothetical protein